MKFLSICSGIEAASVAWNPLGWQASGFSEIEPFPCAVLAHHYPDVPNHGNMMMLPNKIRAGEVEAPDLLCGGTPCQAFSVAGLRQSLDDARGNLSLTFCEIADAIDSARISTERKPAIIFWENVPGVLNTKDNAFGCFLGALAGEDNALVAPGGRWANAGFVDGPQRAVAWRVLDAQYFGVAQRRRRVFVVASARADFDSAAVLFEFEGVRRDIAPSREAGKTVTRVVAPSLTASNDPSRSPQSSEVTQQVYSVLQATEEVAKCIPTVASGKPTIGTLMANAGTKLWLGNQEALTGDYHILQPTYAIQGSMIGRNDNAGPQGDGINEEVCFTQNATDRHAVAQPIAYSFDSLSSNSMKSKNPDSGCKQVDLSKSLDTSRGLDPSCNQGGIAVAQSMAVAVGTDLYNGAITGNVAATMGTPGSSSNASGPTVMQHMVVRRLTPVECERLQGFPDNYTNIPWRKQPESPDGPRYKALGNSWAVPVVRWIGERIVRSLA